MNKKEQSAEIVSENIHILRCSLCHHAMNVVGLKSIVCENNHTFDFAKQGYVNMLTRPINNQYDKDLFTARHKIIQESDLYASMHEQMTSVIMENFSNDPIIMLDAGCGEGSHLQKIVDRCQRNRAVGIGLDISKEGILMAAKSDRKNIWLVGDLAKSPLANHSCHVVLNILSPANYEEFKRILSPNGLVLKVVPRTNYLQELRVVLSDKKDYHNDEPVALFKKHFHLVDTFSISYKKVLKQNELSHLVYMSPLAWNTSQERIEAFINRASLEVTVDLAILVGQKLDLGE